MDKQQENRETTHGMLTNLTLTLTVCKPTKMNKKTGRTTHQTKNRLLLKEYGILSNNPAKIQFKDEVQVLAKCSFTRFKKPLCKNVVSAG